MAVSLRQKVEDRLQALKPLRTDYEPEWYDIARLAQPSRSRFLHGSKGRQSKAERAMRRHWNGKLQDPHGIEASRTLTNGMTSGLTSASRPWFTLTLKNSDLMEEEGVRDWLSEVEKRMYAFLAGTNFYGAAKSGYAEMGLFGTEACIMLEHDKHGAVCHSLTAGEYWIACGDAMQPDVLYRDAPMTVREIVQTFGKDTPKHMRDLYDRSDYAEIFVLNHALEPNSDFEPGRFGSKPWRSVYWWDGDTADRIIRERGFHEQPFWAPRWDVASGETYGASPGMDSLPGLRELQMQTKRWNEITDQIAFPEKVAPPGLRLTGQPRSVKTASGVSKDNVFVPYAPDWQALKVIAEKITDQRAQIDGLMYADLFNAITNMRGVQPRTVEEIAARNEEKLTQLGPVIERVSTEKLEIVVERTYGIMLRGGLLPPVPQALSNVSIDIEFVSILTQMQRMVGIGQIERTAAFIGNVAGLKPEAADKLDVDELIDEYAERAGSPPRIIRSSKEVSKDREARAQQEQMAQTAGMAPALKDGAEAARLLSEADGTGQSVIDRMTPA